MTEATYGQVLDLSQDRQPDWLDKQENITWAIKASIRDMQKKPQGKGEDKEFAQEKDEEFA